MAAQSKNGPEPLCDAPIFREVVCKRKRRPLPDGVSIHFTFLLCACCTMFTTNPHPVERTPYEDRGNDEEYRRKARREATGTFGQAHRELDGQQAEKC